MVSSHDKESADGGAEKLTLESALNNLEEIVKKMEAGSLSLDEGLALFEQGVTLTKYCNEKIREAERKVEMLVKKANGSFEKVPFQEDV